MSEYFCKKCGTNEHISFGVEVIPMDKEKPEGDVYAIYVDAVCDGCGDWISVDVTPNMADFFDYFGPNRDEGTLMLDREADA